MTISARRIEKGIDRIATRAERRWNRKIRQTSATMIDLLDQRVGQRSLQRA